MHSYEPDKILSQEEYDEITDMVHNNIKDQLDGGPMFFVEEFEEDNVPVDGENYEEVPKKIIRQRKVNFNTFCNLYESLYSIVLIVFQFQIQFNVSFAVFL